MKFCSTCGSSKVSFKIPTGDTLPRHICDHCGYIFYINPRVICGSLVVHEEKILLCRRAIEPRRGYWTLPAGFLENGETTQAAAIRETIEEACAKIEVTDLYTFFNIPHINQVHLFFRGFLTHPSFKPGVESLEVGLFSENEIPWDELAFPTIERTLKFYCADLIKGIFPFRIEDIYTPTKRGQHLAT